MMQSRIIGKSNKNSMMHGQTEGWTLIARTHKTIASDWKTFKVGVLTSGNNF